MRQRPGLCPGVQSILHVLVNMHIDWHATVLTNQLEEKSSPSKPMNGLTIQYEWYLCNPNIVPQIS
jgi:hypothetical protein